MTGPSTAREALILEALGEVAVLLDRVESLNLSMETHRLGLLGANTELAERLKAFEAGMSSITQNVKARAVEHILRRTSEVTSLSVETQARAMAAAARLAFSAQVDSNLTRLASSLQQAIQRVDRPWDLWLTHAATAVVSAAVTWWVVSSLACK